VTFFAFSSYYTAPLFFVQEIDGLRIITSDKNEFLQVVPKPLRDVFEIAAKDPSSTLYEASVEFYDVKFIHLCLEIKVYLNFLLIIIINLSTQISEQKNIFAQ
jgi:hypothetical protein